MIGKTLGHYEITGQPGKGGMGEVYRARDTKLNRDVALKVLPSEFANDPERMARFKREAQLLASPITIVTNWARAPKKQACLQEADA